MGSKLESGTRIADRYGPDRVLAEGGMGIVWAATHEATGEPVALELVKGAGDDPVRQSRMVREVRAASAVRHPDVCAVLDFVELEGGSPVMVMERLEGESLDARLAREKKLATDFQRRCNP